MYQERERLDKRKQRDKAIRRANKRANDSQVRTLAVDASLGGVSSFPTESFIRPSLYDRNAESKVSYLAKLLCRVRNTCGRIRRKRPSCRET